MTDGEDVLGVLHQVADAVAAALAGLDDWGLSGKDDKEHHSDLVADAAVAEVLDPLGYGVLSEESGLRRGDAEVVVVVDPVDGSTNASRGIPWYATSLCAVDAAGPLAALVVNLASGESFTAVRGGGARRNGAPIAPSGCTVLGDAIVGIAGWPANAVGWSQFRSFGAAALDLCSVACGRFDGYVDCVSPSLHGVWDYLGALLVCNEAGVPVVDAEGRDLVVLDPTARRTPVAAATPALLDVLVAARHAL